jgi:dolichol-phosphate mannosyltransferase
VSPELSIVMPCYNEAETLPRSIPPLLLRLDEQRIDYEVVLVDNGSKDETKKVIDAIAVTNPRVRRVDVEVNQGYGWGILKGLEAARGGCVAYMCSDGQVTPEDVVRTWWAIQPFKQGGTLAKVRRVTRDDGWLRWTVSRIYNMLALVLFGLTTTDANGTPKFFARGDLDRLKLTSKDWFIDAEVMIKSKQLRLNVVEVPIDFYRRAAGRSRVRIGTAVEFLWNMLKARFGGAFRVS